MRRGLGVVAAVVVLAVAIACDPGVQTPSSSPSSVPTVASTSASPTTASPTPTSSEALLFAEADAVFRAYQKVAFEIAAQGGADTLPVAITPYVTREYGLALESQYRDLKAQGRQTRNGDQAKVSWTRRAPNAQGSLVAVGACIDSTAVEWRNADTVWAPGGKGENAYYFTRDSDGRLKIFDLANLKSGSCS